MKTVKRLITKVVARGSDVFENDQIKPFILDDNNVEIRYWNPYVTQRRDYYSFNGDNDFTLTPWN